MRLPVKIIQLLLILIMASPLSAKTRYYKQRDRITILDTVLLKVSYLKTFREFEDDNVLRHNIYLLKIGEEISTFSCNSTDFFNSIAPTDVTGKDENEKKCETKVLNTLERSIKECFHEKINTQIFKNHPDKGRILVSSNMIAGRNRLTAYEEPLDTIDWQLEDGDTIVCGYPCNRATTTFHGRTWQVWYTLDIPYSDGPWKLCGLPGMILKATDSKGDFDFTAIAINEEHGESEEQNKISISNVKIDITTPKNFEQLYKLYYYDIIAYNRTIWGSEMTDKMVVFDAEHGKTMKAEQRFPCLIEYYGKKKE